MVPVVTVLRTFDPLIYLKLEAMGYRERGEFLWHLPRLLRFLYKYRTLAPANEQSVDHLRDILVRSRFWLSSPEDFNDPFDMAAKYIAKGTQKETQARIRKLLKRQPNMKWKERFRETPKLVAKPGTELATMAQTAHDRIAKNAGVCSFAGDPRSILMWSHYGANHEGFCIQFEFARDVETFSQALPVEYNDEHPEINWITEFDEKVRSTVLRKHSSWRYELESRIVRLDAARQYLSFQPKALRAIIIGCRVKEPTLSKLRKLLTERCSRGLHLPIMYSAMKHDSRYQLVIKRQITESGS